MSGPTLYTAPVLLLRLTNAFTGERTLVRPEQIISVRDHKVRANAKNKPTIDVPYIGHVILSQHSYIYTLECEAEIVSMLASYNKYRREAQTGRSHNIWLEKMPVIERSPVYIEQLWGLVQRANDHAAPKKPFTYAEVKAAYIKVSTQSGPLRQNPNFGRKLTDVLLESRFKWNEREADRGENLNDVVV